MGFHTGCRKTGRDRLCGIAVWKAACGMSAAEEKGEKDEIQTLYRYT